jgi:long-chain fatty acid transport protein
MKQLMASVCLLALGSTGALAGGLDRSGQGIDILFQDGGYVELSFGQVSPSVSGSLGGGALPSGSVAPSYSQFSLGIKQDINDKFSFAVILDQPFGADVAYPASAAPYPFAGTTAQVTSQGVTAIARYKINDRMAVHAGIRRETLSGTASIPAASYALDVTGDGGTGYLVGASYEIPDIALRVALTYSSGATQTLTGTEVGVVPTSFDVTTPKSVNLDFQTGVAANTLVFGSIRWVNWSAFDITPPVYLGATTTSLVSYANDVTTYSLGVGRKFSDKFSGSLSVAYEDSQGIPASNLSPTDGFFSVQLGGKYTMGDMSISGGVRYVMLGDATTETVGASFTGNTAIGVGIKVGFGF